MNRAETKSIMRIYTSPAELRQVADILDIQSKTALADEHDLAHSLLADDGAEVVFVWTREERGIK